MKSIVFRYLIGTFITSMFFGIGGHFPNGQIYSQTQFQQIIGGTNNDNAYSIVQTTEGGYILVGSTQSFGAGGGDMYIVKFSASGELLWSKTIGGGSVEEAKSIAVTDDGGYVIAGNTTSFGAGSYDMFVVKLDGAGNLQWERTFGGSSEDCAYSIIRTADGSFAVAGYTNSFGAGNRDILMLKLNRKGNLIWSKTIGGASDDNAYCIIETSDGGYALAGYTYSFGTNRNIYLVKLNSSGNLQWSKTIGGTSIEEAFSIIQAADGGYTLAGYKNASPYDDDMYIVKLDNNGTIQWGRIIGGTGYERAYSIVQTPDGGYTAAGFFNPQPGEEIDVMYIVKLNGSGTIQWNKTGVGPGTNHANSIIRTADGGYSAAGNKYTLWGLLDMYIVKLDTNANSCSNFVSILSQSVTGGTTTSATSTVTSPTPTITSPVSTINSGGTITYSCLVGNQPISNELPEEFKLYNNYPNPFNPSTKIQYDVHKNSFVKLVIFDALGREVETLVNEEQSAGTYYIDFNGANLSSGIYFYKLDAGGFTDTKKMLLAK
jgi:type IX secretion system substrate protein/putative pyrroloquinoline-quinone binding quinoprotein